MTINLLQRLLLLRAAENLIKTELDATAADARELFEPGDRKTVTIDTPAGKVKLGAVSLSEPKPAWKVVDREAFVAWVAERYPTATVTETITVTRVVPAWEKDFLKNPIDATDGEIPDGVDQVTATAAFKPAPTEHAVDVLLAGGRIPDDEEARVVFAVGPNDLEEAVQLRAKDGRSLWMPTPWGTRYVNVKWLACLDHQPTHQEIEDVMRTVDDE